jgi:hypothetical protein
VRGKSVLVLFFSVRYVRKSAIGPITLVETSELMDGWTAGWMDGPTRFGRGS